MKIKELQIQNFKSIADVKLINPNPFTVFAGANGSGKSNLFEAIEFLARTYTPHKSNAELGAIEDMRSWNTIDDMSLGFIFGNEDWSVQLQVTDDNEVHGSKTIINEDSWKQFVFNHSRIFINHPSDVRGKHKSDQQLNFYASNLEQVLKRLLSIPEKREEIIELLQMFVPGFDDIQIETSTLSGSENLLIFEKGSKKPFPKYLISDGTYNILALIVAVLQSDEPQFLCIEEPENGLHPQVIKELVHFFREQCEEKGHYIWLTTHSQSLVSELNAEELMVVNKENGATKIKQFQGQEFYTLKMDEAWLSNVLGGGLPW